MANAVHETTTVTIGAGEYTFHVSTSRLAFDGFMLVYMDSETEKEKHQAVLKSFSTGGTPLFSIARGAGETEKAHCIMGNTFSLLSASSVVLMCVCLLFRRPIMFLFGASEASYAYANAYLKIYLLGNQ